MHFRALASAYTLLNALSAAICLCIFLIPYAFINSINHREQQARTTQITWRHSRINPVKSLSTSGREFFEDRRNRVIVGEHAVLVQPIVNAAWQTGGPSQGRRAFKWARGKGTTEGLDGQSFQHSLRTKRARVNSSTSLRRSSREQARRPLHEADLYFGRLICLLTLLLLNVFVSSALLLFYPRQIENVVLWSRWPRSRRLEEAGKLAPTYALAISLSMQTYQGYDWLSAFLPMLH